MKSWLRVTTACALCAIQSTAWAETVTLRATNSDSFMTGELIGHDDTNYILKTQFGEVRIERSSVVCEGDGCPVLTGPKADIVISGSDTVGEELMPLLIEGYAEDYGAGVADRTDMGDDTMALDIRDDRGEGDALFIASVESKGSSTGLKDLIAGENTIAMSSRPARGSEIRDALGEGRGNISDISQEYVVAVDSILVAVSPDNPIGELSVDQLGDLFSGRVANWSELGGPDLAANVYTRNDKSGTYGVFTSAILKPSKLDMAPAATIVSSNAEMADLVAEDPGGIGYVGFASIRNAKPVDIIASCGIRMSATPFAAKTEEYLLERRLRLYVDNGGMGEHARGLLDYAVSPKADLVVQKAGFIDLGVEADTSGVDTDRLMAAALAAKDTFALELLRDMLLDLNEAERLSTTFRFALGSRQLDNKAARDIDRIVEFLQRPEHNGKEVMLVGFTDSDGSFSANVDLSRQRAAIVRQQLQQRLGAEPANQLRIRATGYGELSPVGCNDSSDGRRRNRRVEVWLR